MKKKKEEKINAKENKTKKKKRRKLTPEKGVREIYSSAHKRRATEN